MRRALPTTDEWLAYLDAELDGVRRQELETLLASSEEARVALADLRRIRVGLSADPPGLHAIDLAPRVLHALDRTARRSMPWRIRLAWLGTALGAGAALLMLIPRSPQLTPKSAGVTSPLDGYVGLDLFVEGPKGALPVQGGAAHDGRFMLAYRNLASPPFTQLAVLAVDGAGTIYWFYPPRGIEPGTHELPDAIQHTFAPGKAWVVGTFARGGLDAAELEQRVVALHAQHLLDGAAARIVEGAGQHVIPLEMR